MAIAAANVGVKIGPAGLGTASGDDNLALQERESPFQFWFKNHKLASVSQQNIWDGAGRAKIGRPGEGRAGVCQQAAFFVVAASVVIPVKKATFFSSRCSHYTRVRYAPVRVSTLITSPSSTKLGT
jgi:hypothetical protein